MFVKTSNFLKSQNSIYQNMAQNRQAPLDRCSLDFKQLATKFNLDNNFHKNSRILKNKKVKDRN